jgi:ankyrin repeat protein
LFIAAMASVHCGPTDALNLLQAVDAGHAGKVDTLLAEGAPADVRDAMGRTLLMRALWRGHQHVAVLLLAEWPTEVDGRDDQGWTAVGYAAAVGADDVMEELLARGWSPDPINDYGNTPLSWAARGGHLGAIEILIRAGAQLDRRNQLGWTALDIAEREQNALAAAMLRRAGASPGAARRD